MSFTQLFISVHVTLICEMSRTRPILGGKCQLGDGLFKILISDIGISFI